MQPARAPPRARAQRRVPPRCHRCLVAQPSTGKGGWCHAASPTSVAITGARPPPLLAPSYSPAVGPRGGAPGGHALHTSAPVRQGPAPMCLGSFPVPRAHWQMIGSLWDRIPPFWPPPGGGCPRAPAAEALIDLPGSASGCFPTPPGVPQPAARPARASVVPSRCARAAADGGQPQPRHAPGTAPPSAATERITSRLPCAQVPPFTAAAESRPLSVPGAEHPQSGHCSGPPTRRAAPQSPPIHPPQ